MGFFHDVKMAVLTRRDWLLAPSPLRRAALAFGGTSLCELELLHSLATTVRSGCIVEVGSFRGRSTLALSAGSQVPVFAIEPHEPFTGPLGGQFGPRDRAAFYRNMLRGDGWKNVRLVNLSSETLTEGWKLPVGLLFIDGDHTYEGVSRDWLCWRPHLREDVVVAFDDATDRSLGPHRLIREILAGGGFREIEGVGKMRVLQST